MLSLSWEGYPLHFIRDKGWGFLVPFRKNKPEDHEDDEEDANIPFESLIESCPVIDCNNLSATTEQSERVLNSLWKDVEVFTVLKIFEII